MIAHTGHGTQQSVVARAAAGRDGGGSRVISRYCQRGGRGGACQVAGAAGKDGLIAVAADRRNKFDGRSSSRGQLRRAQQMNISAIGSGGVAEVHLSGCYGGGANLDRRGQGDSRARGNAGGGEGKRGGGRSSQPRPGEAQAKSVISAAFATRPVILRVSKHAGRCNRRIDGKAIFMAATLLESFETGGRRIA